jgi:hypothetical protein
MRTDALDVNFAMFPAFMQFDVISTETEDVLEFLKELRDLILKNGLVVVAEHKL